ncbi:MAG: CLC_0170 family protein [Thermoanaerobacteraceae bacterium]
MYVLIKSINQYFSMYILITIFIAGFYESYIEPRYLDKKGLKRDAIICETIGICLIITGVVVIVIKKLFPF